MSSPIAASRSSIRVALNLPFGVAEVAEYLFEPEVVQYWLGQNSLLRPQLATPARLPHAVATGGRIDYQPLQSGVVSALAWPADPVAGNQSSGSHTMYELIVKLDGAPVAGYVALRLTARSGRNCRIRIERGGLSSANEVHASVKVWQGVLTRIGRLMSHADKNRRRERQAVIVVHGIGEQRPGQLLRQFVANVFDKAAGEVHFVKPDYVSSLFEMRMVTVPRNDSTTPTTDVYELYWAHLIRDTTLAQVYAWIFRLMISCEDRIPKTLIRHVRGLWVAALGITLVFLLLLALGVPAWLAGLGLGALAGLPGIISTVVKTFYDHYVVGYAGDAARYLEPRPENIARRQEIREAGVKLLNTLRERGRYSRIIVYGHSLGSVIAYDILSHSWAQQFRDHENCSKMKSRALRSLEDLLNPREANSAAVSAEQAQVMQHEAWLEQRRNGFKWLVSDFVTAGSPLTHARWLLNLDSKTQFADLVRERSYPTCPPQTETVRSPVPGKTRKVFTFTHAYPDKQNPGAMRSIPVPHHAGLFAVTRWTNFYFPFSGFIDGDPIAGPLVGEFGAWVKDVRLNDTKGFAHSRYTDRNADAEALSKVRAALNLQFERPLTDLAPSTLHPSALD